MGYLGLLLLHMGYRAAGGGGLISVSRGFFGGIGKIFSLVGRLGAGLSFYGVWALS